MTLEKLVKVTWIDAATGTIPNTELTKDINDFLIERISYGRLYLQNNGGIVLTSTNDKVSMEYIAIPRPWIKKIEYGTRIRK